MESLMDNFTGLLAFSIVPLLLVVATASVAPAAGALLALRNEIMLALALPSVANAAMALVLMTGINADKAIILYPIATVLTLATILPFVTSRSGGRLRELHLAGLFTGGQVCAMLFSALSPHAHNSIAHLLNGEVMAAGTGETAAIITGAALILLTGIVRRRTVYAWCEDETFFRTTAMRYRLFVAVTYSAIAAIVTVGVATVGPLLVTALMVFPALFGDIGKKGADTYMLVVIVIGCTGSIAGFLFALILDLPPALCAATGAGVIGASVRIICTAGSSGH